MHEYSAPGSDVGIGVGIGVGRLGRRLGGQTSMTDHDERRYWERHTSYRDAESASARAFADPKAARIAGALGLSGSERILDVGAGTGHLGAAFERRGHEVVAVDLARALLLRNPARSDGRGILADALRLPFASGSFPLVIEASLLHHVDDPVAVLREMARVSQGPVAAVEPNRNHPPMFLFSLLLREEWRALRFRPAHLRRLAEKAGLQTQQVEATGWVYQNKTPRLLAGWLGKWNRNVPCSAYALGVFRKAEDPQNSDCGD